ncbi:MAG TPA: zf-HC2 domain-containing protein [Acetivibrio sp.]|nr:zf-HC2 domain-containing protein [Acetivibrio sp.]
MSCEQFEDSIMKHIDGEINDIENNRLMKHLRECAECSRKLEELKSIMGTLEQTDVIEPPFDLEQTVMEKVKKLDVYNKKLKEKKLMMSYFAALMIFTVILLLSAILFRENLSEFMLFIGIPKPVTYMVYGYLTGLGSFIVMVASCIKELKDEIADFNYLLAGLFAIVLITKIYEINSAQRKNEG